jgi:hypothetical protein
MLSKWSKYACNAWATWLNTHTCCLLHRLQGCLTLQITLTVPITLLVPVKVEVKIKVSI